MRNYQIYMPAGVRKYNVRMPLGGRKYKVSLPDLPVETCQDGAPNLIPTPTDFTGWQTSSQASVTGDVSVSPGGIQDADRIDIDGNQHYAWYENTGFTPDALLDLQVWIKLISDPHFAGEELRIINPYSASDGDWRVDLTYSTLGDWSLIDINHPSVTVVNAMKVESSGRLAVGFSPNFGALRVIFDAWCIDMRYQ